MRFRFLFFGRGGGVPGFLGGVPGFLRDVPGFLAGVPGFWQVFRIFWGVFRVFFATFLVFLWVFRVFGRCSGFFGGVPGFSGVPECSVMFRCSGVPVFLEVLHAHDNKYCVMFPVVVSQGLGDVRKLRREE